MFFWVAAEIIRYSLALRGAGDLLPKTSNGFFLTNIRS